jgi:hypothetical protein
VPVVTARTILRREEPASLDWLNMHLARRKPALTVLQTVASAPHAMVTTRAAILGAVAVRTFTITVNIPASVAKKCVLLLLQLIFPMLL